MYWDIVEIRPEGNYTLSLRFADGLAGTLQLNPDEFTGVLSPLREPQFFEKVFIEHGVATWPGELDLAPDTMYREIQRGIPVSGLTLRCESVAAPKLAG